MVEIIIAGIITAALVIVGCWPLWREGLIKPSTLASHTSSSRNANQKNAALIQEFAKKAEKRIKIVSGNLNPDVHRMMTEYMDEAFRGGAKITVQVISGPPSANPETGSENPMVGLKGKYPQFVFMRVVLHRPKCHFMVVDGRDLIVEDPHPELSTTRYVHVVEGNLALARQYEAAFDNAWDNLEPNTPAPAEASLAQKNT